MFGQWGAWFRSSSDNIASSAGEADVSPESKDERSIYELTGSAKRMKVADRNRETPEPSEDESPFRLNFGPNRSHVAKPHGTKRQRDIPSGNVSPTSSSLNTSHKRQHVPDVPSSESIEDSISDTVAPRAFIKMDTVAIEKKKSLLQKKQDRQKGAKAQRDSKIVEERRAWASREQEAKHQIRKLDEQNENLLQEQKQNRILPRTPARDQKDADISVELSNNNHELEELAKRLEECVRQKSLLAQRESELTRKNSELTDQLSRQNSELADRADENEELRKALNRESELRLKEKREREEREREIERLQAQLAELNSRRARNISPPPTSAFTSEATKKAADAQAQKLREEEELRNRIQKRCDELKEANKAADAEATQRRQIADRIGPNIRARFASLTPVEVCRIYCVKSRVGRTPDKNNLAQELRRCMAMYHPDKSNQLASLEKQVEHEEIFKNISAMYDKFKNK